ncbi:MAG TPA: hypothetical protein VGK73_23430 [Polyangiaceae bacterium]
MNARELRTLTCVVLTFACARTGLWAPMEDAENSGSGGRSPGDGGARTTGGSFAKGGNFATGGTIATGGQSGSSVTAGSAGEAGNPEFPVVIAAGSLFTCGRGHSGRAKCWGGNRSGSLGIGEDRGRGDAPGELGSTYPDVDLGDGERIDFLDAGGDHVCVRLESGGVKCWGGNSTGQLGLGDSAFRGATPDSMGENLPVVDLGTAGATGLYVTQLASGVAHNCAIFSGRDLKCWGGNGTGQLGLGDTRFRGDEPGEMHDALPFVDLGTRGRPEFVAAGYAHTCAILDSGAVKCFGNNDYGQLGQGDTRRRGDAPGELGDNLPEVDLGAGNVAMSVATGGTHTCAILQDLSVRCWGSNSYGQLGLGDIEHRGDQPGEMGAALPTVELGAYAIEIVAGDFHTCARLGTGKIKCWGYNVYGQLGQGHTDSIGDAPEEMPNLQPIDLGTRRMARHVTSGGYHVCAVIHEEETVKCWGWNDYGQLGLGDQNSRGDEPGELGDALPTVDLEFR